MPPVNPAWPPEGGKRTTHLRITGLLLCILFLLQSLHLSFLLFQTLLQLAVLGLQVTDAFQQLFLQDADAGKSYSCPPLRATAALRAHAHLVAANKQGLHHHHPMCHLQMWHTCMPLYCRIMSAVMSSVSSLC